MYEYEWMNERTNERISYMSEQFIVSVTADNTNKNNWIKIAKAELIRESV